MRVLCFVRRRPPLMAIGFAYGDGLSDRAEPIGRGEGCRPRYDVRSDKRGVEQHAHQRGCRRQTTMPAQCGQAYN